MFRWVGEAAVAIILFLGRELGWRGRQLERSLAGE